MCTLYALTQQLNKVYWLLKRQHRFSQCNSFCLVNKTQNRAGFVIRAVILMMACMTAWEYATAYSSNRLGNLAARGFFWAVGHTCFWLLLKKYSKYKSYLQCEKAAVICHYFHVCFLFLLGCSHISTGCRSHQVTAFTNLQMMCCNNAF